jgi:hypothetical protein
MKFGNAGTQHDGAQRFIRLLKNGASSHDPALLGSCKCSHLNQYAAHSKNMTESELEKLIKRAIISTLTERSDLLENAVTEAILDMKLGLAIEEGDTGEYVDEKQISSLTWD